MLVYLGLLSLRCEHHRRSPLWFGADEIAGERVTAAMFRAMALVQTGSALGENDIEHPMQMVFDAPKAAHGITALSAESQAEET